MMMGGKFVLLCSAALLATVPASAQDAPQQPQGQAGSEPPPQAEPPSQAEPETAPTADIIVTAQKRSESVQRVPAAVQVVGGGDLVRRGATDITGLAQIAPATKFVAIRNSVNVYVRGVGQTLTAANADPAVALNLNGAYVPTEMAGASLFDLERVEVLPGPQGTLYGRNAAGGVINLVSRRPGEVRGADGFIELGNFNRIQVFAGVDLPITDTLRTRTALQVISRDSFFTPEGENQRTQSARFTAEWKPDDATSLLGVISYNKEGGIGQTNQNNPPPAGNFDLPFDARQLGLFNDFETWFGTLEFNRELSDAITLTYLGAYGAIEGEYLLEGFFGPPIARSTGVSDVDTLSNELRLNGEWSGLNAVLGAYQYRSRTEQRTALLPNPAAVLATGPYRQVAEGYAAFGQVTYSITPAVRVTGGARLSWDKKDFAGENSTTVNGVRISVIPFAGEKSWTRLDWKVGAEADLGPASLLYASAQTGFNQGGFSTAPTAIVGGVASLFRPMKLLAFTAGGKNSFADGRVTFNLEAFYYDYKDYQVSSRSPITAQNEIFNADKSTIYGVDAQLRIQPSDADTLNLNASILNAKFDRLATPTGRFDGLELPYAPDFTVNADYTRSFDLANGAAIEAWANVSYTDGQWAKFDHAPGTLIEDYVIVDASLTWRSPGRDFSISAWGRNLTNTFSFTNLLGPVLPGPGAGSVRPPRTYGVRLSADF